MTDTKLQSAIVATVETGIEQGWLCGFPPFKRGWVDMKIAFGFSNFHHAAILQKNRGVVKCFFA